MKAIVLASLLLIGLFSVGDVAFADGLVPCTGAPGDECQACKAVDLVNNVVAWLIGVLSIIIVLVIVYAGLKLVTSGGNPAAKQSAKSVMTNAIIGYIIVLGAWLFIDYGMKALFSAGDPVFGVWNEIRCVDQSAFQSKMYHPTPDASRGTAFDTSTVVAPDGTIDPAALAALAASGAPDDVVNAAAAANGLAPEQSRNLRALMRVESGGCTNKVSPVGALGCMQIMPQTARQYDPSLSSLTDAQVRDKLLNDDAYNIGLSTQIYKDLDRKYSGDTSRIYAAYNGGQGANQPSTNCPGKLRWQCEWDGSNCRDGVGSDCRPNTGYIETRRYVQKVAGVAEQLD